MIAKTLRIASFAVLAAACSVAPGAPEPTASESQAFSLSLLGGWVNAPYSTRNASAWIDPSWGIVHLSGAVSGGTSSLIFTLPSGYRPTVTTYVPVDLTSSANGRLIIGTDGSVRVQVQGDGTDPVPSAASGFTSLEGVSFATSSGGFTPLTLQNGWTPYSSGYAPYVGLFDGTVRFKGAISSGTTGLAFTLPAAYRPGTDVYVPVDLCTANKGRLHIQPSGAVTVSAETNFSSAQCFTSLDGAWFVPTTGAYTALTLQNGWTNAPYSTTAAAAGIIDGDDNAGGIVSFQGAIQHGSGVAFTLPPSLWPSNDVYVPVDLCNAHNGRLHVTATGAATIDSEGGTGDPWCFTSLEGASYSIPGFQQPPFPIPFPQMPTGAGSILPKLQLASVVFSGEVQGNNESNQTFADNFGRFIVQSNWLQTVTSSYRTSSPYQASYLQTYVLSPNQGSAYQGGIIDVPTILQNAVSSSAITLPTDTTGLVYEVFATNTTMESQHGGVTINGHLIGWILDAGNGGYFPRAVGTSHEIAEEITDYNQGYAFGNEPTFSAWQNYSEVGDVCEGTSGITETSPVYGTQYVASIWSNAAGANPGTSPCIPANPWYANVSPSWPLAWNQWNIMPINTTRNAVVTVTLTAWSNGTPPNGVSSWNVTAVNQEAPTTPLPATLTDPANPGVQVAPLTGVTMHAGQTTTLTFTAPSTAGAFFIEVVSTWQDTTGYSQTSFWPLLISVNG